MRLSNERAAFLAITVAAFVVRLAFVVPVRPLPVSDFGWYFARAQDIVRGLGYSLHGYPTALWPPGWPYVLAGVVKTFGPSVLAGEMVQALFGALTAGIVFLIARALFGWTSGIAAGLIYAALPSAVQWCATLASEPLYTLLWALVTYIWIARSPRQTAWFALSGVLLGAAALVRPSALLYWIVPLGYALCVRRERAGLRAWVVALTAAIACTAVTIAPLTIRNYRAFGTLVLVSNNGGTSLYEGNNAGSSGTDSVLADPRIQKLLDDPRTEAQADRLASQLAVQYIKTHPKRELLLVMRRLKVLYARDDSAIRFTLRSRHYREAQSPPASDRKASAVAALDNAFYYATMFFALLGLAGCFRGIRASQDLRWTLVLGMIVYNTVIFALFTSVERYRYPTMPYFCAFAGLGLIAAWSYTRSKIRPLAPDLAGAHD